MKNSIKNLIITGALVIGLFGITNAQMSGEFSTDVKSEMQLHFLLHTQE